MRRLAIIALVAMIGMAVLATPPVAAEQSNRDWRIGGEGQRWEGVSRPEPPSTEANAPPPDGDQIMEPYAVFFSEDYAAVPEMRGRFKPEFMVVVVQEGSFALDTAETEPGIVVFPAAGQPIPVMQPKKDAAPYYELTDPLEVVQDPSGGDCTLACSIPADTVVQVKPGDRIVAREGALCVWCLLNSNFEPGNEEAEYDDQGLLQVFALLNAGASPDSFSWIRDWEEMQAQATGGAANNGGDATPAASGPEQTMLTWAFNPQARCRNP